MRKMKDSGIEWIGEIPEEWKIVRYKNIMHKEKTICDHYHGQDIISLTMNGVIVRDLNAGGKMPTTFDGYQYVEPEKLLLCLFDIDVTPRCVGVIKNYGLTSPAYSKFVMHKGYDCNYYDYLLRTIDDKKVFVHLSKNLRSSLTENDFGVLPTIAPNQAEQTAIAAYLDRQCTHIDNIIEKTKTSIEEYKKLKQAVITQAVTKGIRGKREMKDSGIDWIGEIPEGYSVCRLKFLLEEPLMYGANESGVFYDDNKIRYIRITDITPDGYLKDTGKLSLEENTAKPYILKDLDVLFARSGATVGKAFIYKKEYGIAAFAGYLIRARVNNNICAKYLYYYTMSSLYVEWKNQTFIQSTIQNIGADRYNQLPVVLPNSTNEQTEIAAYLDQKCTEIDAIITKKQQFMTEMENYKKSLIYECVTGKREVSV